MKILVTFMVVCVLAVGLVAYRVLQVRQSTPRPAPVAADQSAGAVRTAETVGPDPAKAADAAVFEAQHAAEDNSPVCSSEPTPGEAREESPEPPPKTAAQASVQTEAHQGRPGCEVHWASDDGSPAALRRLAAAREALAADPYHTGALRDELAALRLLGRWDEAQQTLKRLAEAEPDNVEVKLDYARNLTRQGLWNQAIDPLRQVVERQSDNLVAWSLLAAAHQTNGHLDAARQSWTRVIELSSDDPAAYANRGQVYVALRDWPAAAADLERSCALDPGQADQALALSQAYSQLGRYQEAKDRAADVLRRNPRNVRAMNRLAELAWQASRADPAGGRTALREALDWWQKSLAIDPNQPAIRARLEAAAEERP
jgi:tetratricopeptide (TPR) repeat protein